MVFATWGLQCWDTGQAGAEFETLEPLSLLQLCCCSGTCHSSLECRPKQNVFILGRGISQASSLLLNKLTLEQAAFSATHTEDPAASFLLVSGIKQ